VRRHAERGVTADDGDDRHAVPDRRDPWMGIELRHLEALSAIRREGTFSEAALSLGYVQSAVSGQISALERLTGARLVERSRAAGRGRLTVAGELLLGHYRDILDELEAAHEGLQADAECVGGLRIGIAAGVPDHVVTSVAVTALAGTARVPLEAMTTVAQTRIVAELQAQTIDVALTNLPVTADDVATAELTRQPVVLAVNADSRLARAPGPPPWCELSRLPMIVWREGSDPSRIEIELEQRGLAAKVVVRTDAADAVPELVATGVGVALLPRTAIHDDERVALVGLADLFEPRVAGIAWLRSRSRDVRLRQFIDRACSLRDRLGTADARV